MMATVIDYFDETYHERDAESDLTKTMYKKSWLLRTSDIHCAGATILAHADLPALGEHYHVEFALDPDEPGDLTTIEEDENAILVKLTPKQDNDNPNFWVVVGEYTTEIPERSQDPLSDVPDVEWKTIKTKKAIYKDIHGTTIKNAAGEPFLPPAEVEKHFKRLTYVRNEASFNPITAEDYEDTLNASIWKGFPVGTVKCESIEAKRMYDRGLYYWRVTYVFAYNADGWSMEKLNRGRGVLTAANDTSTLTAATFAPGVPAERLLAADGTLLASGATPIYLSFEVIESSEFDDLGIGSIEAAA